MQVVNVYWLVRSCFKYTHDFHHYTTNIAARHYHHHLTTISISSNRLLTIFSPSSHYHLITTLTGLMLPRDANGAVKRGMPSTQWGSGYTEGNAWHHSFPPYTISTSPKVSRLNGLGEGADALNAKSETEQLYYIINHGLTSLDRSANTL